MKNLDKNKIAIFDLDDTLIKSLSRIRIINNKTGNIDFDITPSDFNNFDTSVINDTHYIDFSDFNCFEILKKSIFKYDILDILKKYYESGIPVSILTARSSSLLIRKFFLYNNIDIHPDLVIAVNDPLYTFNGSIAERKAEAILKFIDLGFSEIIFFDDSDENLKEASKINGLNNTKIKLVKVN